MHSVSQHYGPFYFRLQPASTSVKLAFGVTEQAVILS
nr:MAG TPA: hypothetical protein [Caudoviricetes sp.]